MYPSNEPEVETQTFADVDSDAADGADAAEATEDGAMGTSGEHADADETE